jgi:hypothetical protein
MGIIATPVVGAAVTGLTTPGYPLTNDTSPPGSPGIAYYVGSLTGTQTGVRSHSISSPFTCAMFRPLVAKTLGTPNPTTGIIPNVPSNTFGFTAVKGVAVAANQPYAKAYGKCSFSIPAGAETYDAVNVAALISFVGGVPFANGASFLSLFQTGAMSQ